jgi:hypothetical protein
MEIPEAEFITNHQLSEIFSYCFLSAQNKPFRNNVYLEVKKKKVRLVVLTGRWPC